MESKFHALKDKQALGWVSLVLLLVLALSACAGGNAQPAATVAPTATTAPPATAMPTEMPTEVMATEMPTEMPTAASEEATINVATDSNLGQILVDGEGMTLYMFTKDTMDTSNCSGKCLESWPPLLTQGSPKLGAGVDPAMIGSADLPDGTKIVTYNHMPLYYYIKDSKAGDVNGQDVNKSWYVVSPDGMAVGYHPEPIISLATDPTLGQFLVDQDGMTLYMFTKDTMDTSNCSGKCLENWPPLLTSGSPQAGDGVDASMLGSAALPDGTKIVTYNHMPLYYYIKDSKAGDINGQDVNKSWYVVSPDGMAVGYHPEPTINVATDPTLGQILVDQDGMTLYMFAKDTMDTSSCSGQCLDNWPPLLTSGSPQAGDGVDASMLGSTTLADGTLIVTYNHMPLYHYIKDSKPGDVNGQGVGTSWYVVAPDGMAVGK